MSIVVVDRRCRPVPDWQHKFLAHVLPRVQSLARIQFRRLPAEERDEATAEAVATALVAFAGLIRQGKDPTPLAGQLAHFAALRVKAGRAAGSRDSSLDVLSRRARQRRGFSVASLDATCSPGEAGWRALLVEDRRCTPAETAISRIDFNDWLNRMPRRRRQIAETLAAGHGTDEVAELFQLSKSRISQLRREFETSWREFQSERPRRTTDQLPASA